MAEEALMRGADLSRSLGARFLSFGSANPAFSSVSIDSRKVQAGGLFVALPGTVQDGHLHVEAAFRAGAVLAMVAASRLEDLALEEAARNAGAALLVVEDTLRGLQEAARIYLEGFPHLLRVGITGSYGKTTTKEIAAAMVGREKRVVMNPGNLNSETGLPLAVFQVRPGHEVGIFEMGMNRKGEIAELARILKPQLALITNVGLAHIGMIGTARGIAEEKKCIFAEFSGTETALIPEDDPFRDFLAQGIRGRTVFYGPAHLEAWESAKDWGLEGTEITWEGVSVRFGLPGRHNLRNALAAAALAEEIPVGAGAIREGLASVRPVFGRSEILRGPVTVIRDCYNSNPDSMAEVLDLCDGLAWPGRRVYVIGSMLELGELTGPAHEELGRRLARSRADRVFLYGEEARTAREVMAAEENQKVPFDYTDSMKVLSRALSEYVRDGDLVLLKGSRGCALEQLTGILTAEGVC
jgi:UDP-N-acetylmuramoyl-tripeptide--D-alanyl-D-alanine ligase